MNKRLSFLLLTLFTLITMGAQAQTNNGVEMADGLYQSGKIFVVVGVLSIIFIGIVIYLAMIDRKISKLEKKNND